MRGFMPTAFSVDALDPIPMRLGAKVVKTAAPPVDTSRSDFERGEHLPKLMEPLGGCECIYCVTMRKKKAVAELDVGTAVPVPEPQGGFYVGPLKHLHGQRLVALHGHPSEPHLKVQFNNTGLTRSGGYDDASDASLGHGWHDFPREHVVLDSQVERVVAEPKGGTVTVNGAKVPAAKPKGVLTKGAVELTRLRTYAEKVLHYYPAQEIVRWLVNEANYPSINAVPANDATRVLAEMVGKFPIKTPTKSDDRQRLEELAVTVRRHFSSEALAKWLTDNGHRNLDNIAEAWVREAADAMRNYFFGGVPPVKCVDPPVQYVDGPEEEAEPAVSVDDLRAYVREVRNKDPHAIPRMKKWMFNTFKYTNFLMIPPENRATVLAMMKKEFPV